MFRHTRSSRTFLRTAAAAMVALAVTPFAGCSNSVPVAQIPAPAPAASSAAAANTAAVTFKMKWPPAAQHAHAKGSKYLPATAQSASITVLGGYPQYLNSPTSTLTFTAPVGLDTFVVLVYDEQNGQGNVLSRADITQKVSGTTANVVATTLNGVIASLKVALSNPAPAAGTPARIVVTATGLDADGNTIVGPSDYNTPILLSIVDPANSGTLSLAKTLLQAPGSTSALAYSGSSLWTASIVASANGVPSAAALFAPKPTIYHVAVPNGAPQSIVRGPDGNMWFTDDGTNSIGRITPAGSISEFTVPTNEAGLAGITAASDGRLWFAENQAGKIGAVTPTGSFQEYADAVSGTRPIYLVDRGDGNVWFTAGDGPLEYQSIADARSNGSEAAPNWPYSITTAADNNLYFTEPYYSKIGRTANANQPIYEIALAAGSGPMGIVRGPDGNLWFTESGTSRIGRLSTSSFSVTGEFYTLEPNERPENIVAGADGALWFTEGARIGRITTAGVVSEYPVAPGYYALSGIGVGADGSLWFCDANDNTATGAIGHLVY